MLLPFTLVFGLVVLYLIDQTDLASDSVLSIVLSGALAIGVLLTSLIKGIPRQFDWSAVWRYSCHQRDRFDFDATCTCG
jgi:ABC-type Mn2+/Zn2+ transport system permease subunit